MNIFRNLVITSDRKPALPGYEAFEAWALSNSYTDVTSYNQLVNALPYSPSTRIRMSLTTPLPAAGRGCGSSWGNYYNREVIAAVVHAFPTQGLMQDNFDNQRMVIFRQTLKSGNVAMLAITRNGYTTGSRNGGGFGMDEFIYWDFNTGKAMTVNPFLSTIPVEFAF